MRHHQNKDKIIVWNEQTDNLEEFYYGIFSSRKYKFLRILK